MRKLLAAIMPLFLLTACVGGEGVGPRTIANTPHVTFKFETFQTGGPTNVPAQEFVLYIIDIAVMDPNISVREFYSNDTLTFPYVSPYIPTPTSFTVAYDRNDGFTLSATVKMHALLHVAVKCTVLDRFEHPIPESENIGYVEVVGEDNRGDAQAHCVY